MATKGTVSGVIANMVTLTVDGPVAQNEICYILTGGDRLMAEVIKVVGSESVKGFVADKEYLNKFIVSLAAQWSANESIVISTA